MNPQPSFLPSRRLALQTASSGFGYLAFSALASLSAQKSAWASAAPSPLAPKTPHFAPKAKRVIFLAMQGGPSHVDTFDYKPQLSKDTGKSARGFAKLLGSPFSFSPQGESGLMISELFPHLSGHADDLCLVNSMHTDLPNHPQATTQMHTGNFQFVRPSLGAWTLYGLGTQNDSLPGFVTLAPPNGAQNYGSAFLPAVYQGTPIGRASRNRFVATQEQTSIKNIKNPQLSKDLQRVQLDFVKSLNQEKLKRDEYHPEVEGIIESYELAFRMQDELPDVLNISDEPDSIKDLYGINDNTTGSFARQCLSARRLAEAGVRFIQLNHGNWDHHRNLKAGLEQNCAQIDQPIAALLEDLKQRDMLKDTLVIWAGEFGRTPHGQNGNGRDHSNKGYSLWMAGGGVQGGLRFGSTDEHGYQAIEDKVHIHDWHATILHLLGLNHENLTFPYAGRDFRLTDVHGSVVKGILS
ncbi:MAG: DUF1501 domain-containing protein [Verrucomicrobiales bacterium]|nr:DUF1501 domain-containing protein [Verrucomicrobiales bacterium]